MRIYLNLISEDKIKIKIKISYGGQVATRGGRSDKI